MLAGQAGGLPADVWAFGTVLWEFLTWQPPFEGINPYQIINTVQAAARGSGLAVPPPDQLPAGPLGQYGEYVSLMEVRLFAFLFECKCRQCSESCGLELTACINAGARPLQHAQPLTGW